MADSGRKALGSGEGFSPQGSQGTFPSMVYSTRDLVSLSPSSFMYLLIISNNYVIILLASLFTWKIKKTTSLKLILPETSLLIYFGGWPWSSLYTIFHCISERRRNRLEMHHYKGFLKCGVVYGVTSLIDRCIINLRAFVDLWGYGCFREGKWLGRPHHVDWPPEHSIDVRVQNVSFQARVFSIPSKVQGQKNAI